MKTIFICCWTCTEEKCWFPLDCITVTGTRLRESEENISVVNNDVIRPFENPYASEGGFRNLYGNLALREAVIKTSALPPDWMGHRRPARVF